MVPDQSDLLVVRRSAIWNHIWITIPPQKVIAAFEMTVYHRLKNIGSRWFNMVQALVLSFLVQTCFAAIGFLQRGIRVNVHSQNSVDVHYDSLAVLDVKECQATSESLVPGDGMPKPLDVMG